MAGRGSRFFQGRKNLKEMELPGAVKPVFEHTFETDENFKEWLWKEKPKNFEFNINSLNPSAVETLVQYLDENHGYFNSFIYNAALKRNARRRFMDIIQMLIRPTSSLRELKLFDPPIDDRNEAEFVKALRIWLSIDTDLTLSLQAKFPDTFLNSIFVDRDPGHLMDLELINVILGKEIWKPLATLKILKLKANNMSEETWGLFCRYLERNESLLFLSVVDNFKQKECPTQLGEAVAKANCVQTLEIGARNINVGVELLKTLKGSRALTSFGFQCQQELHLENTHFWKTVNSLLDAEVPLCELMLGDTKKKWEIPCFILEKLNQNSLAQATVSFDQGKIINGLNAGMKMKFPTFKLVLVDDNDQLIEKIIRNSIYSRRGNTVQSFSLIKTNLNQLPVSKELVLISDVSVDEAHACRLLKTLNHAQSTRKASGKICDKGLSEYSARIGLSLTKPFDEPPYVLANFWTDKSFKLNSGNPLVRFDGMKTLYWICFNVNNCCGTNFKTEISRVRSFVRKVASGKNSRVAVIGIIDDVDISPRLKAIGCSDSSLTSLISKSILADLSVDDKTKLMMNPTITRTNLERTGDKSQKFENNCVFYLGIPLPSRSKTDVRALWEAFDEHSKQIGHQDIDARWYIALGACRSKGNSEIEQFLPVTQFEEAASVYGIDDDQFTLMLKHFEDTGELIQVENLVVFDRQWLQSRVQELTDYDGGISRESNGIISYSDLEEIWSDLDREVLEALKRFALAHYLLVEIVPDSVLYISHNAVRNKKIKKLASPPVFIMWIPDRFDISLFFGSFCGYLLKRIYEGSMAKKSLRHDNYFAFPVKGTKSYAALSSDNKNRIFFRLDEEVKNDAHVYLQECEEALSDTVKAFFTDSTVLYKEVPYILLPLRKFERPPDVIFVSDEIKRENKEKSDFLFSIISHEDFIVERSNYLNTLEADNSAVFMLLVDDMVVSKLIDARQEVLYNLLLSGRLVLCILDMTEKNVRLLEDKLKLDNNHVVISFDKPEAFEEKISQTIDHVRKRLDKYYGKM